MPAAGVQPVQRWLRELVAEFGWLPGDQGAVAAAGAADVDDGPVRLASTPPSEHQRWSAIFVGFFGAYYRDPEIGVRTKASIRGAIRVT